ncbi:hypothetical protein I4F81_010727 [Pyropia yezoensis]|uniref:Uncharacterized protein n=1 Tax=Pyropia yezoensis TaxID=2788 RepID=A0ACC3CEJ2_PYRYE|nr:hypothetical protein I4F81_010727 [Neopyropia yezoensis]
MRDGCPRSVHTTAAVARIPIALHTIPRAHTRGERARPAECPSRIAGGGRYCPDPWRRRKLCVASVFFPSLCEPHGRREATQDGSLCGSLVPGVTAAVVRMSAFLVTTGPAASLTALLTMSGTAPRCSSPPGWVGAINDPEGGDASAQKLTIGYLLCDEEDHHHPPRGRPVSAGAGRPVAEDDTSQRLDVVEQRRAAGVPRQPPAADRRPALSRDDEGADRSRAGKRLAGHVSSRGTHDEREARPCPPNPRHAVPAGQEEHVARLSIPPLRLPPGDRQGGRPTPTGGSIEWPRVPARQMGRLGDDPQQWSPMAPWAGPLVSRDGRPVRLPPVPSSNPSADTWSGHRGDSAQRPVPADQRAPPHEAPPVRLGKATGRGPKCPSDPAPLGEAPRAAGYRQRPLPALWRPQSPSAEEGPPSSVGSRTAGPDLPRQRPYVPVEGRVARAAPWQRSMGGVGGGAGLPYPPLRALRTAGRGLSNVFHSGLPPLLPPSSTSLSLAELQRPSPSGAPLTHRLDHSDADKASTDGAAKGVHAAASPLDPLRRPCHPDGDIKGGVPDKERSNQPLQLQLVNTNGASRSLVKAEAQPGAGGVIFPSDKAELDPESATPHACEECKERFPHRSQLQSHVRNVHERAGRPFECERCGSRFRQRAHKQKHVAAVHLKEKPYTCKICLHCFGRRSDLNKHDRLVHKRERPYGCDFPGCHARFGQKGDSKKHMATHERSEARRRAAAAAVVATAAAVTGDTATSGAVAAVDDLSGRGPLGDWHSPKERPGAVRGSGWRQTEREWEVEDGDDVDCADKADDLTSRPDDDDGNEEKEADDQDEEGSEGLAATGMYRA